MKHDFVSTSKPRGLEGFIVVYELLDVPVSLVEGPVLIHLQTTFKVNPRDTQLGNFASLDTEQQASLNLHLRWGRRREQED